MKYLRFLPAVILVAAAAAAGFLLTRNGFLSPSGSTAEQATNNPAQVTPQPTPNFPKTVGEFLVTDKEVCRENGKPIVYFFGLDTCPHCAWEKPVARKVFNEFKNEIVYHEDFDGKTDNDVFERYANVNPGYVPFLVLGCKYIRVGAGETLGKTEEESKKLDEQALTAILCKLTDGKPANVCAAVKNQTAQIP